MSAVSLIDFGHILLGRMARERTILVLSAYFDDSGTHASAPVVALGGLLGTEDQWRRFEKAWGQLLAHPLPNRAALTAFHLAPCRAAEGVFGTYSKAERDRLT